MVMVLMMSRAWEQEPERCLQLVPSDLMCLAHRHFGMEQSVVARRATEVRSPSILSRRMFVSVYIAIHDDQRDRSFPR